MLYSHAQTVDIQQLAKQVTERASGLPRVFVGIDGPGASGKSTLAEQLTHAIAGAYLVHVDDFYLPSERRHERIGRVGPLFDLPRLAREVSVPGAAGRSLRYQRYDWVEDELAEFSEVPSGAPIILEGVFCLTAALRDAYSIKIWCRGDPELLLARGLARDGEGARSLWVDVWLPAESEYIKDETPEQMADLVVDSSSGVAPSPQFRIVSERNTGNATRSGQL